MKREELNKTTIKRLALHVGFKLKKQDDGSLDLNDYVYDFASLIQMARFSVGKVEIDPPPPQPPLPPTPAYPKGRELKNPSLTEYAISFTMGVLFGAALSLVVLSCLPVK